MSDLHVGYKGKPLIVKVQSYGGDDTMIFAGSYDDLMKVDKSCLYMVVDNLTGAELDNGYRTHEEAAESWPHAVNARGSG